MISYKVCHTCNQNKPISDFYKHKTTKDGYMSVCKKCHVQRCTNNRRKNPEKYAELARKWRRDNPERYRQTYMRSLEKHREEIYARHRKWSKENRELCNAYRKATRRKYRDYYNAYMRQKRAENEVWYYSMKLFYPIRYVMQKRGRCVSRRAEEITGLPAEKLYNYLLRTWEEEYGTDWNGERYEIDHITPRSTAKTKDDVDKLFRYENLRLLTPEDNHARNQ